jgi:hypothetical protein
MTRRELAALLQVSEASVGEKIKVVSSTFSLDELLTISRELEVDLLELLPGADYEPILTGRGRKRAADAGRRGR